MALRISLPVFVAQGGKDRAPLEWSMKLAPDGRITVHAKNPGNVHYQVSDFELHVAGDTDPEPVARASNVSYVLAGQEHEWIVASRPERVRFASELRLKAFTDGGEIQTAVKLDR
jgi:P pilus assembly chaperone PapD